MTCCTIIMLSPWLGVVPVVGVVTAIKAATSGRGEKRRNRLNARDDRFVVMSVV